MSIQQTNSKWFFPVASFGTKYGLNDSGLETFLDNPLDSLVRETIQNSLDAKRKGAEGPVKVSFNFFNRPLSQMPGLESLKTDYIDKALLSWGSDTNEHKFIKSIKESLEEDMELAVLKVSDYNTTGLNEQNWNALVKELGVSSKSDNQAAGSKGIGKNAPFAASEYRMVFYNTRTENYDQSIGVISCVSFNEQNSNDISQSRGYFGSENNEAFDHQYTFMNNRDEIGTDVFVVGVKPEYSSSQHVIILNVLENFLLSIFNETLVVEVDDEVINKENIAEHTVGLLENIGDLEESRVINVIKYFKVLNSEQTKIIQLDEDLVTNYDFINIPEDATFWLLSTDENLATRNVLLARKSGMMIKLKPFRQGVNFTGIFQATGPFLNQFLREMESAEHTNWVAERAEYKNRRIAKKFLYDLNEFLKRHIKELFEDGDGEEIDAYGLAELLPDNEDSEPSDNEETTTTIEPVTVTVTIKETKIQKQKLKYTEDEPDDTGGGGGSDPGGGGRKTPTQPPTTPRTPNPDPPTGSPTVNFREVTDVKVRMIDDDYTAGKYVLRVEPKQSLLNAKLVIAVAGESGDYQLNIKSADGCRAKVVGRDSIEVPFLEAEKDSEISVEINYGFRVRMKVMIYESK